MTGPEEVPVWTTELALVTEVVVRITTEVSAGVVVLSVVVTAAVVAGGSVGNRSVAVGCITFSESGTRSTSGLKLLSDTPVSAVSPCGVVTACVHVQGQTQQ